MTICFLIVGVGIMFTIISAATGNADKKKAAQPATNNHYKYYQPNSARADSIIAEEIAKEMKKVLESKQLEK